MTDQKKKPWLLYGAYGFTGELIVEEARRRGLHPVLAGRREEPTKALADKTRLPYRVFPLDDEAAVREGLEGVSAVVLAAGPFSATSRPVLDACLERGVHYLDITGEVLVFEACRARGPEAERRGIVVMPGVGFDVVPTDCLARRLADELPSAVRLELAFHSGGSSSAGTTRTMIEALPKGGCERQGGRLVRVPNVHRTRRVRFRDRERVCASIPWGDLSTAYQSTGIPNITVYMSMPPGRIRAIRAMRPLLPLTGARPVQRVLKGLVDRYVKGPPADVRGRVQTQLWGRVEDADGRAVEAVLTTPEGYTLTATCTVECAERIVRGDVEPGARTPAGAFGARFIEEAAGCAIEVRSGGART